MPGSKTDSESSLYAVDQSVGNRRANFLVRWFKGWWSGWRTPEVHVLVDQDSADGRPEILERQEVSCGAESSVEQYSDKSESLGQEDRDVIGCLAAATSDGVPVDGGLDRGLGGEGTDAFGLMDSDAGREQLDRALTSLRADQLQLVRWRLFQFVTYREVAKRLKCSESVARQRCEAAVLAFRNAYQESAKGKCIDHQKSN